MLDLIKKHLQDFAAEDWDAYRAALADDCVYEELATRRREEGAEAYVQSVRGWKRAFPDLEAKILDAFVAGDVVVSELEWEGTHRGPLEGPAGTIAATQKRCLVRSILVNKLKDGQIIETRHYFDLLTLLGQLGVAPMLGAPAQAEGKRPKAPAPPRH